MTTVELEDKLSPAQMKVYNLRCEGKTPEQIARKLDLTVGVVNAQLTRIANRGVSFPGENGYEARDSNGRVIGPVVASPAYPPLEKPRSVPSTNDMIQAELEKSGQAMSPADVAALAAKLSMSGAKDIHPMMMLGITIQYVRFAGGRFSAHQMIEDVYGALRAFCNDSTPDKGGVATPFPMSDADRIAHLEEQNKILREEVAKYRGE